MKYDKFIISSLVLAAAAITAEACTSWVITPGSSESGRMILHKCRDNNHTKLDADMVTIEKGFRVMRIGADERTLFGLNEKGVAFTTNNGNPLIKRKGKSADPQDINPRRMLQECATAEEAVAWVRKYCLENRGRNPGGIYYLVDPAHAFMMDVGDGYFESFGFTSGVSVVANSMHLPGIEEATTQALRRIRVQRAREANTRAALAARKVDGKYTLRGTRETSRLSADTSILEKILPFRSGSISAVTFEIDPEFPEFLSCAYIALGPQRQSVYLPTPMALAQFPEKIRSGEWGDRSMRIFKTIGYADYDGLNDIERLEDAIIAEFSAAREAARKLLREGKRDEAVKLLNDTYMRHYRQADKLLDELEARFCKEKPQAPKAKKNKKAKAKKSKK